MTREAIVQREKKRKNLTEKFSEKRKKIKDQLKKQDLAFEDTMALRKKLQKLPLNSSPTRRRNRCSLTGRPRGVYRKFALGRSVLRKAAMRGDIPGLTKASW